MPYVGAVVAAYGTAVWEKVRDQGTERAADATVSLGRRILARVLNRPHSGDLVSAVQTLAEEPTDPDYVAGVRGQLKRLLRTDDELRAEVAELLADAGVTVVASGDRAVAAQHISGVVSTGDNATIQR